VPQLDPLAAANAAEPPRVAMAKLAPGQSDRAAENRI
jgi:hypothetical protein